MVGGFATVRWLRENWPARNTCARSERDGTNSLILTPLIWLNLEEVWPTGAEANCHVGLNVRSRMLRKTNRLALALLLECCSRDGDNARQSPQVQC
jgi:hypothetical protein